MSTIPEFYHKYVQLVQEDSVADALKANTRAALDAFDGIGDERWSYRYQEGKWSIKEMVLHVIDAERIFSYRALCIARGETGSLPGFDENSYAARSDADRRTKADLLQEFEAVRQATLLLFQSFSDAQLAQTGVANNKPIGVNSIGFIAAGHVQHHLTILKERYLANG